MTDSLTGACCAFIALASMAAAGVAYQLRDSPFCQQVLSKSEFDPEIKFCRARLGKIEHKTPEEFWPPND